MRELPCDVEGGRFLLRVPGVPGVRMLPSARMRMRVLRAGYGGRS